MGTKISTNHLKNSKNPDNVGVSRRKTEECMPADANLQKILIRHINFDTQNKSATSNSRMRFPGSRIAGHNDIFPFSGMK